MTEEEMLEVVKANEYTIQKLLEYGVLRPDCSANVRSYNIGNSNYSKHVIQPWAIWQDWNLNPWDADIVKRVLRTKEGSQREEDYRKIKHICDERIRQLESIQEPDFED